MNTNRNRLLAGLAALAISVTAFGTAAPAWAQAYPTKPITLVVPFAAAGTTDILARAVGQKLSETLGQPVVIDNRPGAGGNTGANIVAKAAPDGYTLLMGTIGTQAINPSLYSKMPYDAAKDFSPVTLVATVPNMMVVNPDVPAKTVQEFIKYAKANPGKLNMASSGSGTSIHLAGELFKTMAGVDMVHVPYKGSGPALVDLMGGQVQVMFDNMPSALPHVKSGKLRAIAVTTPTRAQAMPDLPTIAESGLAGFDAGSWFGVLAPAGTPKPVIDKLYGEIAKILKTPDMAEKLSQQGATPIGNTPTEFEAYIKTETTKWAAVVKASGATAD